MAGALQHLRPFLGPLFAWAAALAMGTFSKFPEAVRSLLSLIEKEVARKPMSVPRRMPEIAKEIFRVDAKSREGSGDDWRMGNPGPRRHQKCEMVLDAAHEEERTVGFSEGGAPSETYRRWN